ncbi:amino acid permease, partial [Corynebacterium diphtheriae]
VLLKSQSDPFTLVITAVVALVIVVAQWFTVRHRSDEDARQGEHEQH